MAKKMHLAWFMNFTPDEWREPFGQGGNPWDGRFYMEMAQTLERACFDYIMIEDKLMVPQTYGGSRDFALKNAMMVPKHDPAPLATAMGMVTSRLGVVATMSTMAYPPFLLARLCSTIDSLTRGRFGWNIVTSAEDLAAKNFNMDKLPLRETRYEMAEEYMEVVNKLFDSWDHDAVVLDREKGIYVDPSKVRTIDHVGKHYQVRGPLNTVPSPQQRPIYVQAGASPRGRDFAARFADSIISVASGPAEMKAFRDDIRTRAAQVGRDPDEIKVLFCVTPDPWRDRIRGAGEVQAADVVRILHHGYASLDLRHHRNRFLQVRPRQTAAGKARHEWRIRFPGQVPAVGQWQNAA